MRFFHCFNFCRVSFQTATDKSSKDETTYQYVGVLPGADRKPLRTILDLEECGAVFMDIYERVVHYKSTEKTVMMNLQIFKQYCIDKGLFEQI